MAKRVEGVEEKILICAVAEFLEKGYEGASLRTIAQKAETSTNSIYVRFNDKNGLYRAVVEPVMKTFLSNLQKGMSAFAEKPAQAQESERKDFAEEKTFYLIDYIYEEFERFQILITSGERDVYQDFLHQIVEIDVMSTKKFIEDTGNNAIATGKLDDNLAHVLSVAFYSGFFEMVHHKMSKDEAKDFVTKLRAFYNAGWMTIFSQ
ncbi:MAG: TetR/AcrR family transcriptional regulator [Eubacteriales bacterium]